MLEVGCYRVHSVPLKINVSVLISRTSKWNIRIIADKVLGNPNPVWLVSLEDTCVKAQALEIYVRMKDRFVRDSQQIIQVLDKPPDFSDHFKEGTQLSRQRQLCVSSPELWKNKVLLS